jgi:hypothetical protein
MVTLLHVLTNHSLTPSSTVLLEKLTVTQLVKNFPIFTKPKGSSNCSQQPATGGPVLSHINLIHLLNPISLRSTLILSCHQHQGLRSDLIPSGLPNKCLSTFLISPVHATCPAHLIFLHLMILTTSAVEYKLWSFSLRNFLHPPLTSFLLGRT